MRDFVREATDARMEIAVRLRAVAETLGTTLRRASDTPLNRPIGPHRRFDWLAMDLAEIKEVRKALGGSLNDVVLTVVTGAVRRFLERRGVSPKGLDFRVMAPVSVRSADERGAPRQPRVGVDDRPARLAAPIRASSSSGSPRRRGS